jgi:hypothetical protein
VTSAAGKPDATTAARLLTDAAAQDMMRCRVQRGIPAGALHETREDLAAVRRALIWCYGGYPSYLWARLRWRLTRRLRDAR